MQKAIQKYSVKEDSKLMNEFIFGQDEEQSHESECNDNKEEEELDEQEEQQEEEEEEEEEEDIPIVKHKTNNVANNANDTVLLISKTKNTLKSNPTKYRSIYDLGPNEIVDRMYTSAECDEDSIAALFYIHYKHKFLFSSIKGKGTWYRIDKYGIWNELHDRRVSALVSNRAERLIHYHHSLYLVTKKLTDADREKLTGREKAAAMSAYNIARKVYSGQIKILRSAKKTTIMKTLSGLYSNVKYDGYSDVYEKFDNNTHLFAFKNGVYDLKTNKFRKARPNEFVHTKCGYKYRSLDKTDVKKKEYIMSIINSMFINQEDVDYVLSTVSQCMSGCTKLEKIYVWHGSGGNGKGLLKELIQATFGDYCRSIKIDYFNSTKHGQSATAADSVAANLKQARIAFSTEPEAAMTIRTSTLKEWSGNDMISCRDLFSTQMYYLPHFKLFFQSNHDISFGQDSKSGGILRRLEVMTFPFDFRDKADVSKGIKKADTGIKELIRDESGCSNIVFFHILLDYFRRIDPFSTDFTITQPTSSKKATKDMLSNGDPFKTFMKDILRYPDDKGNGPVKIDELQYDPIRKVYEKRSVLVDGCSTRDIVVAFKEYNGGSLPIGWGHPEKTVATYLRAKKKELVKFRGKKIWKGIAIDKIELRDVIKLKSVHEDYDD